MRDPEILTGIRDGLRSAAAGIAVFAALLAAAFINGAI